MSLHLDGNERLAAATAARAATAAVGVAKADIGA